ncbi:NlpC/P60 family protein [Clostridium sp.]|uniref:NlpC/P60 family protein n=1 Tax=Clostridium sp. TaxID=1506 RepID=UPI0037BFB0D8
MRGFKSKNVIKRTLALLLVSIFLLPLSSATKTKAATISKGQAIVNEARKHLGKPYVWGATGPNSFDCSGLTQYVYKQALGIEITRTTNTQINVGREVSRSELQPGDLLFPTSGHVQIYVGNGKVIHSPEPGRVVEEVPMYGFWRARRIVDGNIVVPDNKDGWVYENGKSYYYENGIKKIGGWIYVNGHSYLLDSNDGHCLYGWQQVNGNWYYLNETYGHCELGWVYVNGQKYYTEPTYGHMLTGWQEIEGKTYYFNTVYGHAEKGWIYVNNHSYLLDSNDGHMLTGWQQVNGNWYYLNETYGHCELGWVYVNGQKYYTEPTYGHMLTGWQKVDGKWYYFNKIYGHAETNTIVDGYTLNSDGVAIDKNN